MPPLVKYQQLAKAVYDHVQSGVYPEGEDVVSAELQASALPDVLKWLEQARSELKVRTTMSLLTTECMLIKNELDQYPTAE